MKINELVVEFYLCENHVEDYGGLIIKKGFIWLDNSATCSIVDCLNHSKYKIEIVGELEI